MNFPANTQNPDDMITEVSIKNRRRAVCKR